jgi:hypothetical protein
VQHSKCGTNRDIANKKNKLQLYQSKAKFGDIMYPNGGVCIGFALTLSIMGTIAADMPACTAPDKAS